MISFKEYLEEKKKDPCWTGYKKVPGKKDYEEDSCVKEDLDEAIYQGKEVPLNKRLPGDVKKSKVYVKKGDRVVKVNFGDKNMTIKKNIPSRRKSFRARHHCENPGPNTKARYWSCKAW